MTFIAFGALRLLRFLFSHHDAPRARFFYVGREGSSTGVVAAPGLGTRARVFFQKWSERGAPQGSRGRVCVDCASSQAGLTSLAEARPDDDQLSFFCVFRTFSDRRNDRGRTTGATVQIPDAARSIGVLTGVYTCREAANHGGCLQPGDVTSAPAARGALSSPLVSAIGVPRSAGDLGSARRRSRGRCPVGRAVGDILIPQIQKRKYYRSETKSSRAGPK